MSFLKTWCNSIINGAGGLRAYNKHEHAGMTTQLHAVEWTIRCLANPKCEGSQEVLDAILEERAKKAAQP
jgi:hypothetical protein